MKEKVDSTRDESAGDNSPESKDNGNALFRFISIISYIIIPLFLFVFLIFSLLTCSSFYTGILSRADLIETFVHAKNWQIEEKIKEEIEREVHLEKFRTKYEFIKADYEKKKVDYNTLNRVDDYKRLERQREELSDLSCDRAPEGFKDCDEFEKYKDEELDRLDNLIGDIENYRDAHEDEIEKAEDEMDDAEDAFEDAGETLHDKIEDAKDIIVSHKRSFVGDVYSDIEAISPTLTEELNSKLINRAVKREIEKVISFFSTYYLQRELGNVYIDRLDDYLTGISENLKVKFPEIYISLWVEDEINGVQQKRHLLSDIFIEKINEVDNLKKRKIFIKLFKFADSFIAESIGRSYLEEANLSISIGMIKTEPIEFAGDKAEVVKNIMIGVTWGKYIKFILPVIVLLILLSLFFSSVEKDFKYRSIQRILIYPSLLIIIVSIIAIVFSGSIFSFFPNLVYSPYLQKFFRSILDVITLHLFGPSVILFALILLVGLFFRRKALKI